MFHGQDSFQRLLHKQEGKRAEWEYPFAVAGINISFMLVQMLNLQSGDYGCNPLFHVITWNMEVPSLRRQVLVDTFAH